MEIVSPRSSGAVAQPVIRPILPALTGIRFLAAFGVVLFHYVPFAMRDTAPQWLANAIGNGDLGVTFFFILSGFVMSVNYVDHRHLEPKEFWIARFSRIYPSYLLAFLATAPWYLSYRFATDGISIAAVKSVAAAGIYLTMLQAWIGRSMFVWNGPAWSISDEAFFYAMFPVLKNRIGPIRSCRGISVLILTSLLLSVLPTLAPYLFRAHSFDPLPLYKHPVACLPLFVLGIGLGKAFSGSSSLRHGAWLVNGSVLVLALLFCSKISASRPIVSRTLLVGSMSALIFGLACGKGTIATALSIRPMTQLGEASYALYIIQVPVACLVKTLLGSRVSILSIRNVEMFTTPVQLSLYLFAAVTMSLLVSQFVDQPARSALRRVLSRRSKKPSNAMPGVLIAAS